MKIKDMDKNSLPIEKLLKVSEKNLSNAELLAILLGTGSKNQSCLELANTLLKKFENLNNLTNVSQQELCTIYGISIKKSARLLATFELSRRANLKPDNISLKKVTKPEDAFNLFCNNIPNWTVEHLYLLTLNAKNHIISIDLISKGTINSTLISPRETLMLVLKRDAVSFILGHNHPSNGPTPSEEDIYVTNKIYKAAQTMNLALLDHIIFTKNEFTSIKALGLIEVKVKGGEEI